MQYLISMEEMEQLVPKKELESVKLSLQRAKEAILELEEWECVHKSTGYCDLCPIQVLEKSYDNIEICTLRKCFAT